MSDSELTRVRSEVMRMDDKVRSIENFYIFALTVSLPVSFTNRLSYFTYYLLLEFHIIIITFDLNGILYYITYTNFNICFSLLPPPPTHTYKLVSLPAFLYSSDDIIFRGVLFFCIFKKLSEWYYVVDW